MAMASGGKGFQCLCRSDSTACGLNVEPGISIKYDHDFFASHHGSGAIDSIGKDGPKAMDEATDFGGTFRYAAGHCYTFCQRNLTAPDPKRLREGIWSATGTIFGVFTQMEPKNLPWEQMVSFQLFLKLQISRLSKDPTNFIIGVPRMSLYLRLKLNS